MNADALLEGSWVLGPLLAFAAGIVSFLSPCVLPLVPGYLSLMSGLSGAEIAEAQGADTRKLLRATLLFVAGFTVVFVILFTGASALSGFLTRNREVTNRVAGVLVIVMGLFLAGIVSPKLLMRERRLHVSPARLGPYAAPVMGMAFAFGWTPCIGPVLSVVITVAATQDTLLRGILLLLSYSIGLGVPFVASGLAFSRLTGVFAWFKRHFRALNLVSGGVLVVFGILLFTNNVDVLATEVTKLMEKVPGLRSLTTI